MTFDKSVENIMIVGMNGPEITVFKLEHYPNLKRIAMIPGRFPNGTECVITECPILQSIRICQCFYQKKGSCRIANCKELKTITFEDGAFCNFDFSLQSIIGWYC